VNSDPVDSTTISGPSHEDTFKLSHDKLGQGSESRGAGFG
jgi:hypothetical protein